MAVSDFQALMVYAGLLFKRFFQSALAEGFGSVRSSGSAIANELGKNLVD